MLQTNGICVLSLHNAMSHALAFAEMRVQLIILWVYVESIDHIVNWLFVIAIGLITGVL
jgi:hypothetical protein